MINLTDEYLAHLKELAEKATPGPWKLCDCGKCGTVFGDAGSIYIHIPPDVEVVDPIPDEEHVLADAAFIATAREAVPVLVAEVERLTARIERLEAYTESLERNNAKLEDENDEARKFLSAIVKE